MEMYCKSCQHDISRSRSGRCPECGEFFDPLLPETYRSPRHQRFTMPYRWIACVALLACVGFTYDFVLISSANIREGKPRYSNPVSMLQTCRGQLALYANQHNDTYPTVSQLNDDWRVMTHTTDIDGRVIAEGEVTFGPYLQKPPVNPLTESSRVALPGQTTGQDGWEYNPDTGHLRLVIPTHAQFDSLGPDDQDAVVASQP